MKIVMTGATGFIGKATVMDLARQGHEITALVRRKGSALGLPCNTTVWDPSSGDPSHLVAALQGSDCVIHLAGEPIANSRWTDKTKKSIRDSRIHSTQKIVDAIKKLSPNLRPATLICASAIGYYGDRGDEILTETSQAGEGFLSEVVQLWEKEVNRAEEIGVRVIRLRTGVVLGQDGGALEKMKPVILGSGKQWISWIHIQDVTRFISYCVKSKELSGVFNLVSPRPATNDEFTQIFGNTLSGMKKVSLRVPAMLMRLVLGEMSHVVLDSVRVLPNRILESGFKFSFESLKSALEDVFQGIKSSEKRFTATQFVRKPIQEVFDFFSRAENLELLTPPWLNFHITGMSTPKIEENTLINYKLKIHGVPVGWQTRIDRWNPNHEFVDTQLKGPYSKWHHTHRFEEMAGGTLVSDNVIYKIPFGILGSLFAGILVRKDIEKIFAYRMKKISEVFQ